MKREERRGEDKEKRGDCLTTPSVRDHSEHNGETLPTNQPVV